MTTRSDRRRFVWSVVLGLTGLPLDSLAQVPRRMPRIGFLSLQTSTERLQSFLAGMREFGYIEGQTVAIDWRFTEGTAATLTDYAADLVNSKPDLIIAVEPQSVEAVRRLTRTIPIVTIVGQDPVGLGFAQTLSRPGGNITGTTSMSTDVGVKQIELIRSAIANCKQVTVLLNPTNKKGAVLLGRAYQAGAQKAGIAVTLREASTQDEIEKELAAAKQAGTDAIIVAPDGFFVEVSAQIEASAIKKKLPTLFLPREAVVRGALISYGPDARQQYRRTGYYVHRILNGAKPADLPIEQPTQFVLAVNLKTAVAIGLKISPSVLARADEVIQ